MEWFHGCFTVHWSPCDDDNDYESPKVKIIKLLRKWNNHSVGAEFEFYKDCGIRIYRSFACYQYALDIEKVVKRLELLIKHLPKNWFLTGSVLYEGVHDEKDAVLRIRMKDNNEVVLEKATFKRINKKPASRRSIRTKKRRVE